MKARKLAITACAGALIAAMSLTGCGSINPDATVVTINNGEDTITLGYANFAARYQQSMYDQYLISYYGEHMWTTETGDDGETMEDETKESVLDDMEEQYLCKKHAADYGVTITDDEEAAMTEAAAKFIADNPEETINMMGATEEYVRQYLEYRTYYSKVSQAVKEAADVSAATVTDEDTADEDTTEEATDTDLEDSDEEEVTVEELQQDYFDDMMDSWKEETTWKVDEGQWKKVKFDDLFKTIETEEAEDTAE